MTRPRTIMAAGLAAVALAALAGAAEPPQRDIPALEDSRNALNWEADNATGVDRERIRGQAHEVQQMIDRLQRGEQVDQHELDRLLNRTD
jgi:hypothetical protein